MQSVSPPPSETLYTSPSPLSGLPSDSPVSMQSVPFVDSASSRGGDDGDGEPNEDRSQDVQVLLPLGASNVTGSNTTSLSGDESPTAPPEKMMGASRGLSASVHAPDIRVPVPSSTIASAPAATPVLQVQIPEKQTSRANTCDSSPTLTTATTPTPVSPSTSNAESSKTPNVYINGLPPHFPEDELFALTAPYGGVRSVRSFTRHVGERSSGYGFVLFDTVESAERCIEGLRKYRNLHPSFSKQVHKIPGVAYASASTNRSTADSPRRSVDGDSFKARMERLGDEASTNLYIEGLPLSIDDATLAALVSPYTIKSSRLFQTKLSNPPRIIAFVRLETRVAAEEIIERLHGRMVRGWNDSGSRISVRFADTNEQRELRRAERSTGEGDHSPARLTIAQAALLNLRGQEIQALSPPSRYHRLSPIGTTELRPNPTSNPDAPFESNHFGAGYSSDYGPHIQSQPLIGVDYSHIFHDRDYHPHYQNANTGGLQHGAYAHTYGQKLPRQEATRDMAILLDSLRKTGVPYNPGVPIAEGVEYDHALHIGGQAPGLPARSVGLSYPSLHVPPLAGQAQARNGFTPTEEMILQAHARARGIGGFEGNGNGGTQQHQPGREPRQANIGMGVRGRRSVASALSFPSQVCQEYKSPFRLCDALPTVSSTEDDFRSNAARRHPSFNDESLNMDSGRHSGLRINHRAQPAHVHSLRSPCELEVQHPQMQMQMQEHNHAAATSLPAVQTQTQSQGPKQAPHPTYAPHMRASTLPHRSSVTQSANQHPRHSQHSSLSNISSSSSSRKHQNQNQFSNSNNASIFEQDSSNNTLSLNIDNSAAGGQIHYYHDNERTTSNNDISIDRSNTTASRKYEHSHVIQQQAFKHREDSACNKTSTKNISRTDDGAIDLSIIPSASPPLVSPALTYSSSSRTPATLSPSTPFFGSFSSSVESFEVTGSSIEANLKKMSLREASNDM